MVVILLLLVYGLTTIGASVNLHYCMNEFVGWSLKPGKADKCGNCGMDAMEDDGCCKDEPKHFRLDVEQQKAEVNAVLTVALSPAIISPLPDFTFYRYATPVRNGWLRGAPPDSAPGPLNILYCVFLL